MEEHEYPICRELLDSTRYAQLVECLQSCLALVVFHHIVLLGSISNIPREKKKRTDTLKCNPSMNLIY